MKRDLPSECGGCGLEERWLLHNVCVRQTYRRLCTSCVLKLHSGSFCPICFEVYEGSKLPLNRVMCMRCPSVTHHDCVTKDLASSFVCPPCSNPNFSFFDSSAPTNPIDPHMAKALVASAHIAWLSMTKAAHGVKLEADRKVKEAALRRKEAREALDTMYHLKSKHKASNHPTPSLPHHILEKRTPQTPPPIGFGLAIPDHNKKHINSIIRGNTPLSAAVVAQQRFENQSTIKAPGSSAHQLQNPSLLNGINSNYSTHVHNNIVSQNKENNVRSDSLVKSSSDVQLGSSNATC